MIDQHRIETAKAAGNELAARFPGRRLCAIFESVPPPAGTGLPPADRFVIHDRRPLTDGCDAQIDAPMTLGEGRAEFASMDEAMACLREYSRMDRARQAGDRADG